MLVVGNKVDLVVQGISKMLLVYIGKVLVISDGCFIVIGLIYIGLILQMGCSVLLDIGVVCIVIIEEWVELYDFGVFISLGLDLVQ